MKKLFFLLFLLTGAVVAQTETGTVKAGTYFTGSIQFKIEIEGAAAAEIKEMNDIDQMIWHIKDGDYIVQLNPSLKAMQDKNRSTFRSIHLFIADSNELFSLDLENQRAFKSEPTREVEATPPAAVAIADSQKVAGVMCYGYQVTKKNEVITYYAAPQYRVNTALFKGKTEANIAYLNPGLNGYIPLKIVRKTKNFTTTTTATSVKPAPLTTNDFRIPTTFKILPYDYRR